MRVTRPVWPRAASDAAAQAPIEPGDAADLADRWDLVKAELAARRTQLQIAGAARNDVAQSRAAAIETARQKLAQFKESGEARVQAKLKEAIEAWPRGPSP